MEEITTKRRIGRKAIIIRICIGAAALLIIAAAGHLIQCPKFSLYKKICSGSMRENSKKPGESKKSSGARK
ncbi:MAG: hypothetical protein Q4C14_04350 [Bacillota bacterium]|nr:hypothetical protein [Bacillota bacterium]